MTKFPTVNGVNLEGRPFQLPEDLEGEWNILVLAFWREHQDDVDTWIPLLREIAATYPTIRYYELPILWRMNPVRRFLLDQGMRMGIPDRQTRETTITLYLIKERFRAALDIENEQEIALLLVNRAGEIAWSGRGPVSGTTAAQLSAAVRRVVEGRVTPDIRLA